MCLAFWSFASDRQGVAEGPANYLSSGVECGVVIKLPNRLLSSSSGFVAWSSGLLNFTLHLGSPVAFSFAHREGQGTMN